MVCLSAICKCWTSGTTQAQPPDDQAGARRAGSHATPSQCPEVLHQTPRPREEGTSGDPKGHSSSCPCHRSQSCAVLTPGPGWPVLTCTGPRAGCPEGLVCLCNTGPRGREHRWTAMWRGGGVSRGAGAEERCWTFPSVVPCAQAPRPLPAPGLTRGRGELPPGELARPVGTAHGSGGGRRFRMSPGHVDPLV